MRPNLGIIWDFLFQRSAGLKLAAEHGNIAKRQNTGKNNGFPFLDILGYLKNTHKNPKFGKVRQVPTREFPTKFPDWNLSHSSKFGIFVGILYIEISWAKNISNPVLFLSSQSVWNVNTT